MLKICLSMSFKSLCTNLKEIVCQLNFKPYFTRVNKIHNHSTRFSNSLYGSKTLSSYLECKVWEEIPRNLKDQSYLGAFQSGLFFFT